ncbi:helix-turn-helix domain-containing protein [Streptomyces sp. NPDC090741]|uniref:helix-turn-helix domain-containing protein n=1 Tax=Streptomyces sp. NPDC090741 TaxID=3365967 RepID=UPI0037F4D5B9
MSVTRSPRPARASRAAAKPSHTEPKLSLPRIPKGKRLTGDARTAFVRAVVAAYMDERQGSIRQITQETGRAYGTIHRLLTDANVPLRGRGGAHTRGRAQA